MAQRSKKILRIQKSKAPVRPAHRGERGYMLAVVAVFTSVLLITLTAAVINWQKAMQREQEEELLFRGRQFMRAIELWQRKFPGTYPTTMDALLSSNNTRFLRKKWKDPITNSPNWRLIKIGPDGSIQGLSLTPGASPLGPSTFGTPSQSGSNPMGTSSSNPYGSSTSTSSFGSQSSSQMGNPASGSGTTSNPYGQSQTGSAGSPFSPVLGGIVGVASTSEKTSIKTFNGKSKYSEWEFVYVPRANLTGTGQQPGQIPTGTGQGTLPQGSGTGSSPGVVTPATPRPRLPGTSPMQ